MGNYALLPRCSHPDLILVHTRVLAGKLAWVPLSADASCRDHCTSLPQALSHIMQDLCPENPKRVMFFRPKPTSGAEVVVDLTVGGRTCLAPLTRTRCWLDHCPTSPVHVSCGINHCPMPMS